MKQINERFDDPVEQARLLEQVHAAVLAGQKGPRSPRPVVVESWRRSLAAEIDPDAWEPPVVFADDRIPDVRESHPLAACVPLLRQTLLDAAGDTTHIMIITDVEGNILWREGHPEVCRRADDVRLSEGTRWAESAIGTNAMGTTLATDAPVQIHSAEHLVRTYHSWTCAASPVHDPETGETVGSIDISGPLHTMHPALMALVSAAARLAEGELYRSMTQRHERLRERNMRHLHALRGEPGALLSPGGRVIAADPQDLVLPEQIALGRSDAAIRLGDGQEAVVEPLSEGYLLRVPQARRSREPRPVLRLRFMGRHQPVAELDGHEFALGLRRAELLAVLALRGEGLSSEQLALHVHGEQGNPVTVRAEIHRLRAQLGRAVVRTKPYRLDARVETDFHAVRQAMLSGDLGSALELHGPGLLPTSEAPAVRDEREDLAAGLREAILGSQDPDLMWEYTTTDPGRDDIEMLERLLELLPCGDWRSGAARTRLDRLLHEGE
ncbi:GAF domain-containing protein [Halopolyspora algeriensis]|uniref:GAF domain-containing protein n=1 Tax=Halopolyspora algeriensis TaxID=1500506 RepID=A0A368VKA0_9ACTN|nr:GAF domain-containing protein [Halopolyspora algeriensis]RCW40979.1 GAF domain-containing protein [Halopolyspora algeriensis]TQM53937.1 GAF domain-containing protein [Halopolyspora algeriensis]